MNDGRIFIAGHKGMVGSALVRAFKNQGYSNLMTVGRAEVDLRESGNVASYFQEIRPKCVILAAAKVGGIQANAGSPADFLYENLMIQNNVIHQAHRFGVEKLVFLGSSCIYPRNCPQPMKEEYLLTGPLEPTNEAYALAKIAGLKMAQFYQRQYGLQCICPMPCNLYGLNDSFDLKNSHVLSALVKKLVNAVDTGEEEITLWGSGAARREFLHVDDFARAVLFLMDRYQSSEIINVGTGTDISIRELAQLIARKVSYKGEIRWDTSMPDGMLRKCLDLSKMVEMGFTPSISLEDGIDQVIQEYRAIKCAGRT